MLLILTFSEDVTFDSLILHLRDVPFFRFNIDLWRDYSWEITAGGFRIEDKIGRVCEEQDARAVYLRKLIFTPPYVDVPAGGNEEHWVREQLLQLFYGIRDIAAASGRLALVKPSRHASKLRQMRLAQQWFPVPAWSVFHGRTASLGEAPVVVKTFAAVPVGGGAHVMVREADASRLSPGHPWFVQRLMREASHDVTVVFVNGRMFAFEADRLPDEVDCRVSTALDDHPWRPCALSNDDADGIRAMMRVLDLEFGRFDFLREGGRLWFLEVNPNGQWGWLDPKGDNGLYSAVAGEILAVWERNEPRPIAVG